MARQFPAIVGTEQHVTASDLVRHFGIWQERAARAPVYILHRGRPRLVLTSVDVMDALCAPHVDRPDGSGQLVALLDVIDAMFVLLDADHQVLSASHGARAYFGDAVRAGAALSGLAALGDETLAITVARVAASGLSETIECRSPRFADRLLTYTVDCGPSGCIVQIRDASADEEMQLRCDRHQSTFKAIEAAGGAYGVANLRGRIEQATRSLSTLTGATTEALTSARVVSLVSVSDRSALGDAFEAAIDDRTPQSLSASLLVGGAELRPVTIGLAPLTSGGHITGVTIIIVPATS